MLSSDSCTRPPPQDNIPSSLLGMDEFWHHMSTIMWAGACCLALGRTLQLYATASQPSKSTSTSHHTSTHSSSSPRGWCWASPVQTAVMDGAWGLFPNVTMYQAHLVVHAPIASGLTRPANAQYRTSIGMVWPGYLQFVHLDHKASLPVKLAKVVQCQLPLIWIQRRGPLIIQSIWMRRGGEDASNAIVLDEEGTSEDPISLWIPGQNACTYISKSVIYLFFFCMRRILPSEKKGFSYFQFGRYRLP